MRLSKRALGALAALVAVVAVLIGLGTAANGGAASGKAKGPDRRPPIVLPQAAQEALDRGELATIPTDFNALADQLGLTGQAKQDFVDRSNRVAQQTPQHGDGHGPSEGKAPTAPPGQTKK